MALFGGNQKEILMKFIGNRSVTVGWGYFDENKDLWFRPKGKFKSHKVGRIPDDMIKYNWIDLPFYDPFTKDNDNGEIMKIFFFGLEDRMTFRIAKAISQNVTNQIKTMEAKINSLINENESLRSYMQINSIPDAKDSDLLHRFKRAKELNSFQGGQLTQQTGTK